MSVPQRSSPRRSLEGHSAHAVGAIQARPGRRRPTPPPRRAGASSPTPHPQRLIPNASSPTPRAGSRRAQSLNPRASTPPPETPRTARRPRPAAPRHTHAPRAASRQPQPPPPPPSATVVPAQPSGRNPEPRRNHHEPLAARKREHAPRMRPLSSHCAIAAAKPLGRPRAQREHPPDQPQLPQAELRRGDLARARVGQLAQRAATYLEIHRPPIIGIDEAIVAQLAALTRCPARPARTA